MTGRPAPVLDAVEYLVADDEGHGFENPENQIRLH